MRDLTTKLLTLAVATTLATGCVSKQMFRQYTGEAGARFETLENGLERNEQRIATLDRETNAKIDALNLSVSKANELSHSALGKADEALRAAQGKVLWSVTLTDDRVKFATNKAALTPETTRLLDELAGKVKGMNKAVYVEIEGHTDSRGTEEFNFRLGERRALAVRDYLHDKAGLPLHLMTVTSYGRLQPMADNGSSQGRALNRRVVVKVLE